MANRRSDILFTISVLLALALAWNIRDVLLLVYVAALFAVIVGPGISAIQRVHIRRWHPSKGIAVLAVLVGVGVLLTLLILFLAPPIVSDLQSLSTELPNRVQGLYQRVQHLPFGDKISLSSLQQYAASAVGSVRSVQGNCGGHFRLRKLAGAHHLLHPRRREGLQLVPAVLPCSAS